jgi:Ca-activated chloride channel homolog
MKAPLSYSLVTFTNTSCQRAARVSAAPPRPGAAVALIAFMLFVFVVTAAITIDYSYMQLVRTELRAAADAAAKAGAEALSRTQDVNTARSEAVRYAACNKVGGQAFRLNTSDVTIGRVTSNSSGRWTIQANGSPPNAVRIDARTGEGAAQPAVPLFFGSMLGHSNFTPRYQATAGQQEVEVCLCLDRSGSMNFDMSGEDWSFPTGNPRLSPFTAWGLEWRNLLSPPHPTLSRWAALRGAVDVFLQEANNYNPQPRTALITWGSGYTMPISPFTSYPESVVDLPLPSRSNPDWVGNSAAIKALVRGRGDSVIMGGTNLSAGLDQAIALLSSNTNDSFASKVVVLVTDGEWNAGRHPRLSAYDARARGIIVHCVSMLTGEQDDLQEIADLTGGRYYGTHNEAELHAAFSEIARSLPVVLTE